MEPSEEKHPVAHTYQNDLAQAMNVTDAQVVQSMLADAREREVAGAKAIEEQAERKWYSFSSVFFILLTLGVLGYGAYYYTHLTVPVVQTISVGVFPSTPSISITATTIQQVVSNLSTATNIPINAPTLVNLVTDSTSNTPLTDAQLFAFMNTNIPAPLQAVIGNARLGVVNDGKTVNPFIVITVSNPDKASQEFDIDEPNLLQLFAPALNIDTTQYQSEVGQTFQSQYFYNIPVRTLSGVSTTTNTLNMIFLYGYVNNDTIVMTTDPATLKAVYDTIINQQ